MIFPLRPRRAATPRRASRTGSASVECLERRTFLAGDPAAGFALPYVLDFNRSKTGLLDRDGSGTGFAWAQPNRAGDEYQPRLIDLKIGAGILRLYSTGNADAGSNFEADNSLVNALTTTFAASSKPWVISARVNGPPTHIDQANEQGGIIFGPDQDNYVKLTLAAENGRVGLQFLDEQRFKSGYKHQLPATLYDIGSFASIQTIDLYMAGDPNSGYVRALYRINSGAVKELPNALILRGDKRPAFFNAMARAGVMAQHKHNGAPIDVTFDQFGIQRGVLFGEKPGGGGTGSGKVATAGQRVFNDVRGGAGQQIGVAIRNSGTGSLTIPAGGLTITGPDAAMFSVSTTDSLPRTIGPGQSMTVRLTFTAPTGTALGIKTATLSIASNDASSPKTVKLRGLATAGTGGTNEPSLQRVLQLYEIPVNVGDANPEDVFIGDPPATPNEEITLQQLRKAGAGNVIIQPLAVFGVSSSPALRFGTYEPGTPGKTTELFTIPTSSAQTVNPVANGTLSFDPGSAAFGLYSVWPGFKNTDNTVRKIYSEDDFNTFDTNELRHIRFYPMKNPDGSVVANAYVMAHEEFNGGYDAQDFVAVIYNVTGAAAGPEIGTESLDGPPAPDRLVFNRFQAADPLFPNTTSHTQAKVRVRNTGSTALNIASISATGPFSVLSATGAQTVAPGKFVDVLVQFNGGSTSGFKSGALTINSNDADEPAKVVTLAGYNQPRPENQVEPTLQVLANNMFGFTTNFVSAGQNLDTGGQRVARGEEVLSGYWFRANPNVPVHVRQLSQFHTQGETATIRWHNKGSNTTTNIFTAAAVDAQTLYPRKEGNLAAAAEGTFTPGSGAFGFRVDNEWSDSSKNIQEQPGGGYGHHVRMYPARDANGNLMPDTYLLTMDYDAINYDYNDNVYLITNIRPETPAGAVAQSLASANVAPSTAGRIEAAAAPRVAEELFGQEAVL